MNGNLYGRIFYATNVLVLGYFILFILFSVDRVQKIGGDVARAYREIDIQYNEILDRYSKVGAFILKGRGMKNIKYFNAIGKIRYNLSAIKDFQIIKCISDEMCKDKRALSGNVVVISSCHNKECITVSIGKGRVYEMIPVHHYFSDAGSLLVEGSSKLKMCIVLFIQQYRNLVLLTLVGLLHWYLVQSLVLFWKKRALKRTHYLTLSMLNKSQEELAIQKKNCRDLYHSMPFMQETVSQYFVHYVPALVTRELILVEIDLVEVLSKIEGFVNYQVMKKNLEIKFGYMTPINKFKSDEEIIFLILLNLVFKAVYRSKGSSQINVEISQIMDRTKIKIFDTGYVYESLPAIELQMHELPKVILNKLGEKVRVDIKEIHGQEINIIETSLLHINGDDGKVIKLH